MALLIETLKALTTCHSILNKYFNFVCLLVWPAFEKSYVTALIASLSNFVDNMHLSSQSMSIVRQCGGSAAGCHHQPLERQVCSVARLSCC